MLQSDNIMMDLAVSRGYPLLCGCVVIMLLMLAGRLVMRFSWLVIPRGPIASSPMWALVAIPEGERWNMYSTNGQIKTLVGPQVVYSWGARMVKLERLCASHSQYLWIQFTNGSCDITTGPAVVYRDPAIHQDVKVQSGTTLGDNEVLVVYRKESAEPKAESSALERSTQTVSRHLITGPCLYVPTNASEWCHDFCWHGSTSNNPEENGRKTKGATRFKKLRVCPEQTYFDVEGVRTRDDALVTVKVMLFYRLKDIDTMLRETHDPPGDFVNALSSDVVEFVASKTFEEFKSATENLNDLSVYKQLTSGAARIGFEVTNVVFRGYGAPQRLQKMHDDAIERRTKLGLDKESEEQEQKIQDMKLEREEQRLRRRRQMDAEGKTHELEMQRAVHDVKQKERAEERQAHLEHLSSLKSELGLTGDQLGSYMLAMQQGPPAKVIQLQGVASQKNVIQLQESC